MNYLDFVNNCNFFDFIEKNKMTVYIDWDIVFFYWFWSVMLCYSTRNVQVESHKIIPLLAILVSCFIFSIFEFIIYDNIIRN